MPSFSEFLTLLYIWFIITLYLLFWVVLAALLCYTVFVGFTKGWPAARTVWLGNKGKLTDLLAKVRNRKPGKENQSEAKVAA